MVPGHKLLHQGIRCVTAGGEYVGPHSRRDSIPRDLRAACSCGAQAPGGLTNFSIQQWYVEHKREVADERT